MLLSTPRDLLSDLLLPCSSPMEQTWIFTKWGVSSVTIIPTGRFNLIIYRPLVVSCIASHSAHTGLVGSLDKEFAPLLEELRQFMKYFNLTVVLMSALSSLQQTLHQSSNLWTTTIHMSRGSKRAPSSTFHYRKSLERIFMNKLIVSFPCTGSFLVYWALGVPQEWYSLSQLPWS